MKLRNFFKDDKIDYRLVSDLVHHPENIKIYGENEDVSDLVEKIRKSNRVDSLVVTENNVVISGHRRLKACKIIGIEEVPVVVEIYDNEEDELEALVLSNASREKTMEQKSREGLALDSIVKIRYKQRQLSGLNNQPVVSDGSSLTSTNNKSNDEIAKKVGFQSGRQYERARKVVKKIDELTEQGRTEDAELLTEILNKSPSTAEEFISKVDLEALDFEAKRKLKSGEISAYSLVTEAKRKEKPNVVIKATDAQIDAAVSEYNAMSRGQIEQEEVIRDSGFVIRALTSTMSEYNRAVSQILTNQTTIQNLSQEDKERISRMFVIFEDTYSKDKQIILNGGKKQ